jgi:hypothetical protein
MPSFPLNPNASSTTVMSVSSATAANVSQQSKPIGAIVGGVFGGIAFGILVSLLVVLLIRRRRRAEQILIYEDTPSVFYHFLFMSFRSPPLYRSQHTRGFFPDARTLFTSSAPPCKICTSWAVNLCD